MVNSVNRLKDIPRQSGNGLQKFLTWTFVCTKNLLTASRTQLVRKRLSKTARQTSKRLKMLDSFLDMSRGMMVTPLERNPVRPIAIWEKPINLINKIFCLNIG